MTGRDVVEMADQHDVLAVRRLVGQQLLERATARRPARPATGRWRRVRAARPRCAPGPRTRAPRSPPSGRTGWPARRSTGTARAEKAAPISRASRRPASLSSRCCRAVVQRVDAVVPALGRLGVPQVEDQPAVLQRGHQPVTGERPDRLGCRQAAAPAQQHDRQQGGRPHCRRAGERRLSSAASAIRRSSCASRSAPTAGAVKAVPLSIASVELVTTATSASLEVVAQPREHLVPRLLVLAHATAQASGGRRRTGRASRAPTRRSGPAPARRRRRAGRPAPRARRAARRGSRGMPRAPSSIRVMARSQSDSSSASLLGKCR